ncbi:MAG: response regulator transcription factor [Desulforegulaceae bacterium]|nr:response regulator transcription factor [Desulforegulaceae bacterium]
MGSELILAIDDEEDILELIDYNLKREGFRVITAENGEKGLKLMEREKPDLVLLDLMLPGMDGFDVAKKIRNSQKFKKLPIIMLTAKGEEADVVTGLELGADDYISKPFSPRVLLARIKSVLRRNSIEDEAESTDKEIVFKDLRIHSGRHLVTLGKESLTLTHSEFEILKFLVSKPGWVFTRSQIVDAIHGESYPVTERSVDVQIVGLRKKLGGYGAYIETVRGVGYRFREENYE